MAVVTMHLINNDVGAQTLKTRPGDVFTLGAYVYPKAGNAGGGTIKLQLVCTSTVSGGPAPTTVTAATETVPATGSWSYLTGTGIIPAGYDTVDPVLTLNSVPVTDIIYTDDLLVRETTAAQNVLDTVYNAITGNSGSANPLASLATSVSNWISTLFGTTSVQTTIAPAAVPGLSASKITSGLFPQSMVTGLATFYNAITGAGTAGSTMPDFQTIIDNLNKVITGSATTGQAVSTWLTNLNSWATNLWGTTSLQSTITPAVVPGLSASKITSGTFAQSMVTGLASFYNALTGAGTAGSIMPDFQTIIDNLNKMVTGSVTTGNAVTSWLTNLNTWATNLWGTTSLQSTITPSVVPGLSGSKITSGLIGQSFLNITALPGTVLSSPIGTGALPSAIPSTNIPALGGLYAPNLVLNPDFESTALWVGATGVQDTLQAHSGTHSWQLQGAG